MKMASIAAGILAVGLVFGAGPPLAAQDTQQQRPVDPSTQNPDQSGNMQSPTQQQRDMGVPPGTPPSSGGQAKEEDNPMTKHQREVLTPEKKPGAND